MPAVRRVTMQRFRGSAAASSIEFSTGRPVVLIFGENGTGKSTIVDAIDMVCNELTSISERSSTRAQQHLPTIGSIPAQVEVEVQFDAGTWTGQLAQNGQVRVSGGTGRPAVRILRRRSLLKITEGKPGDRYEQLSGLIEVDRVEQAEGRLGATLTQARRRLDEFASTALAEQDRITRLWEAAGSPPPDAVPWARQQTAPDLDTLHQREAALDSEILALDALLRAERLTSKARDALEQARETLAAITQEEQDTGLVLSASLASLLEQVEQHLDRPEVQKGPHPACPVCEQPVTLPDLRAALAERLDRSRHLTDLNRRRGRAQQAEQTAAEHLESCHKETERALAAFRALSTAAPDGTTLTALEQERRDCRAVLEHHRALSTSLTALDAALREARRQERLVERLDAMLTTLRQTRHRFTQGIFDAVSGEAQRMYGLIHPREPLGLRGLSLDPRRRASLNQQATFHGHDDILPQGFYSEAHLDTLGFCFWLAVVKHTTPDAIVILDDVFTSVDASHLGRIDQMLRGEIRSRRNSEGAFAQLIVVTHYRGWLDRFRAEMPDDIEVKELLRWTLEHGISVHDTLPHTAELQARLALPHLDRQGVASKAGVMLENLLDHFTGDLHLDLPRMPRSEYTLDPLLKASTKASRRFKTRLPGEATATPWATAFDRLNTLLFIRNQVGAHFSLGALDVSDDDIREFGEATLALARLMTCPQCGRRCYRKDHGTHRSCGGDCQATRVEIA